MGGLQDRSPERPPASVVLVPALAPAPDIPAVAAPANHPAPDAPDPVRAKVWAEVWEVWGREGGPAKREEAEAEGRGSGCRLLGLLGLLLGTQKKEKVCWAVCHKLLCCAGSNRRTVDSCRVRREGKGVKRGRTGQVGVEAGVEAGDHLAQDGMMWKALVMFWSRSVHQQSRTLTFSKFCFSPSRPPTPTLLHSAGFRSALLRTLPLTFPQNIPKAAYPECMV